MATVHVALGRPVGRTDGSATALLLPSRVRTEAMFTCEPSDHVVTDGEAAELVAMAGEAWFVTAVDADLRVAFGPSPVAGVDPGHYVPVGQTRDFAASGDGEKMSVMTA